MRFSDAKGHKVVSAATAERVGKVAGFVVDPASRSVVGLKLKKTESGDLLRWVDMTGFGADAVTVADAGRIGDGGEHVAALADKKHRVLGKRVLTSVGDELGKVDDVDFDPESGVVRTLVLSGGTTVEVAGDRLIGIGSFAVVVRATS